MTGDRDEERQRGDRLAPAAVLAAVVLIMVALNLLAPYLADDYCVAPRSVADAFRGALADWHGWNGRVVGQLLGRLFLLLDKRVFDVLNALAFAALVVLVTAVGRGRTRSGEGRAWPLAAAFFLLWFGIPGFGDSMLWLMGSANYLWTTCLVLAFLVPYRRLLDGGPAACGAATAVAFAVLAVAAGCSNENTGAVAVVLAAAALVLRRRRGEPVPGWAVAGVVAFTTGFLFMVLAPGNLVRLAAPVNQEVVRLSLAARAVRFVPGFAGATASLWPVWLVLAGILAWRWRRQPGPDRRAEAAFALVAASFLANGILVAAPGVPARALTAGAVFLAAAAVAVLPPPGSWRTRSRAIGAAVGTVVLAVSVLFVVRDSLGLARAVGARRRAIGQAVAAGETKLVVQPIVVPRTRHIFWGRITDVTYNLEHWANRCLASRLGVESVRLAPPAGAAIVDLSGPVEIPLDGAAVLTGVGFSERDQSLVVSIHAADPSALYGSFLDLRFEADGTGAGRWLVNRLRRTVLPSSTGAAVGYPHDAVRKLLVFYSYSNLSLYLDRPSLVCDGASCTAYLPVQRYSHEIRELYVGWRRHHGETMTLHRIVPRGRGGGIHPPA